MSKRDEHPTEISKVGEDFNYLIPFADDADQSTAAMAEHRVLSRIKTVQALTDQALRDQFGIGSLVIMPARELLMSARDTIDFVPLAFFEEFIVWNDRRDSSGAIVERSMRKDSEVAKRARDPKRWEETYAGGTPDKPFKRRWTEHLNFPGLIYSKEHPHFLVPVCLSFSRGEFSTGRQFISKIMLRRVNGRQAPLWATAWKLKVVTRKNDSGSWYGIDIENADKPFIDQEHVEPFKREHEVLVDQIAKQMVAVDMSESDDGTSTVADPNHPF